MSENQRSLPIVGYVDGWSAKPGENVSLHVSCRQPDFTFELRRLVHGDPNPAGPGIKEHVIAHPLNGQRFKGATRDIALGSCMTVPDLPEMTAVAIAGSFKSTMPNGAAQTLLTMGQGASAVRVTVAKGQLTLCLGDDMTAKAQHGPAQDVWYDFLLVARSERGEASFAFRPHDFTPIGDVGERVSLSRPFPPETCSGPLVFAAAGAALDGNQWRVDQPFNGRLSDLCLYCGDDIGPQEAAWQARRALKAPYAAWDFVSQADTRRVPDTVGTLHGETINRPTRLVTGPDFSGRVLSPFDAPQEFNAAHFHDDDLEDAGWPVSLTIDVPRDLPSGLYAARLTCEGGEDYVPFAVTAPKSKATAKVAVLLPTLSYQIYANMHADASLLPEEIVPLANRSQSWSPEEVYVRENRIASCYDLHSDGSGISMATLARPMPVFVRPRSTSRFNDAPHQLSSDLYILDWLEERGIAYDVITDHDLHADGVDALARYNVILSGTHAEYWTTQMLDGLEAYQNAGGRTMCLSGNSLYWATSLSADGKLAEVRRQHGLRSWAAAPGDMTMSLSGEAGGIWRHLGRAPQKFIGVGMTAMGFDNGRPYARTQESYESRAAFLFDGIEKDLIGDFPVLVSGHGAAGYEIDRADLHQGTPAHALVLASATGFSNAYQLVVDEVMSTAPFFGGEYQPNVRADIVFYETPNNGAVFSTGSIGWCSALSYNGYDNSVSRLTENVLRCFMRDPALPLGPGD